MFSIIGRTKSRLAYTFNFGVELWMFVLLNYSHFGLSQLVLEGVRSRQMGDALLVEKSMLEKSVHHTKKTVEFYDFKASRIEDQVAWVAYIVLIAVLGCINDLLLQLKTYSDQRQRLAEDRAHNAGALESTQRRLLDWRKSSQLLMGTVEEAQAQVDRSRVCLAEMQIELEKERCLELI